MRRYVKDDSKDKHNFNSCESQRVQKGFEYSSKKRKGQKIRQLFSKERLVVNERLSNMQIITRELIKQSIKQNRQKSNFAIEKGQLTSSINNFKSLKLIKKQITHSQLNSYQEQGLRSFRYQSIDINDQIKLNRNQIIYRYKTLENQRHSLRKHGGTNKSSSRLKKYASNEILKAKDSGKKHKIYFSGRVKTCNDQSISNRQINVCSAREINSKKEVKYQKGLLTQRENISSDNKLSKMDKKCRRVLTQIPSGCQNSKKEKPVARDGVISETIEKSKLKQNVVKSCTPQRSQNGIKNKCEGQCQISSIVSKIKENINSLNISRFNEQSILQNIEQIDMLLNNVEDQGHQQKQKQNVFTKANNKFYTQVNANCCNDSKINSDLCDDHKKILKIKTKVKVQAGNVKQKLKLNKINQIDCFSSIEFVPSTKIQANGSRKNCRLSKNNPLIMKSIDKIKHIFPKGFFYQDSIQQILD